MTESKDAALVDEVSNDSGDALKDKYLTFRVGEEVFGFGIRYVTEIVGIQNITEVPDVDEYIKGVINLRGLVIPVIDVRLRFHMEEREYDERTCVIVVQIEETSVGLIVDIVQEVIIIPESRVSPAPKVYGGNGRRCVVGMGKLDNMVVILLDVNKLLYDEDKDKVASLEQKS